jgi:tetratricopeptide (TPR) repeat protein
LEKGLEAVSHLPQHRATLEQAVDLRFTLRSALHPLGDLGRTLANLREAETLAAALDDPRRLGQVSMFLTPYFYYMGAYDQAIAAGQRALTLATADGDVVLHALANQYLSAPYHAIGDYRRALDCAGQTVAYFDGTRQYERSGQNNLPAVNSRATLISCHADLGTFAEGRALGEEGLQIAEAVAYPPALIMANWGLGLLALRQGNLSRALPLLERAVNICQDADLPSYFPRLATTLGAAYTLGGRVADALSLLTRAMEQATAMESGWYQESAHLSLGEAQVRAGRLEEAQTLADRALALTRTHQARGNQAYALHLLGEIAARREPPEIEPAESYYKQALALAGELAMRPLVAHCHRGLGILYAKIGQPEQARTTLATAMEMYQAMEMTFWLPQVEAARAQVEG